MTKTQWRPMPGHRKYRISECGKVQNICRLDCNMNFPGSMPPRKVPRKGKILKYVEGYVRVTRNNNPSRATYTLEQIKKLWVEAGKEA